jgi:hypothetical protein
MLMGTQLLIRSYSTRIPSGEIRISAATTRIITRVCDAPPTLLLLGPHRIAD